MKLRDHARAISLLLSACLMASNTPVLAQPSSTEVFVDDVEEQQISQPIVEESLEEEIEPSEDFDDQTDEVETQKGSITISENSTLDYSNILECAEFEVNDTDIFSYDWKNAPDEELSHNLLTVNEYDVKAWVNSLSEEDLEELMERDTCMNKTYDFYPRGFSSVEDRVCYDTYYDYLQNLDNRLQAFTYTNGCNGTLNVNFSGEKNVNGVSNYSCTSKIKITPYVQNNGQVVVPIDTNTKYDFSASISDKHYDCYLSKSNYTTHKVSGSGAGYYMVAIGFHYYRPAGYKSSYSRTLNANQDRFGVYYPVTYNGNTITNFGNYISTGSTTGGAKADEGMTLLSHIKYWGCTTTGAVGNFNITLTPITYKVNWGNTTTSYNYGTEYTAPGALAAKSGSITVTYNGNGGTASSATTSATWTQPFASYGGLTQGAKFSNLANTQDATVSKAATWGSVQYGAHNFPSATRTGYTFNGWYNAASGGTKQTSGTKYTANTALYAHWTANKYTVRYNSAGGSACANTTATYGTNFTLPTPTKTGYTFAGWTGAGLSNKTGSVSNLTATNGATVDLTAGWTANKYTITYNPNGGTVSPTSNAVTYGRECPTAPTPSKTGYTFKGWSGGTYSGIYNTAANTTVTANWTANTYTVAYDTAGGNSISSTAATYDKAFNLPTPAKTGYIFTGWTGAGLVNKTGSVSNLTPTNAASITLTAGWNPIQYTVKYNTGDSDIIEDTKVSYDQEFTLPVATKTGYHFTGWSNDTVSNITGTASNLTAENNATVNLTAGFAPNNYTVKYDLQGGTGTAPDTAATYNTPFTLPDVPSKDNCEFLGWKLGNQTYNAKEEVTNLTTQNNGEVVIAAQWKETASPSPSPQPDPSPSPQNPEKPIQQPVIVPSVSQQEIDNIKEMLAKVQKTSDLTNSQVSSLSSAINNMYGMTTTQSGKLVDLIKGSVLSEDQKLALLKALTEGTMTDAQKQTLKQLIASSSLSDSDKKALLAAISGISALNMEEQKRMLQAIESGSAAGFEIDGVLYTVTKTENGSLQVAIKHVSTPDVQIPEYITLAGKTYPVTQVADGAFKDNKDIKNVAMGNNVSQIGESAFENCKNLSGVTVGQGLLTIKDKAFKNCPALVSVNLPASLQTIGNSAFENCTKLQTVTIKEGSKLLEIGSNAFKKTGLKSFTLPKSVIKIGNSAFANNKALKTFKFAESSALITIGKSVWEKDVALTKITLPAKLTKISSKSFKGDKKLSTVKIGKSVTEIGTSAFEGCASMKSVTIPAKVNTIGKKAFYKSKKLKKVVFKGKLLSKVGSKAFKKCKKALTFKCPKKKLTSYKKLLKGKY